MDLDTDPGCYPTRFYISRIHNTDTDADTDARSPLKCEKSEDFHADMDADMEA